MNGLQCFFFCPYKACLNPQWYSENLECFKGDFCSFSYWFRKTIQLQKAAGSIHYTDATELEGKLEKAGS